MKKIIFLVLFFLGGCATANAPRPINNPYEPPKVIQIEVTVNKYASKWDCLKAGGSWVVVDSPDSNDVLVGCIEKK